MDLRKDVRDGRSGPRWRAEQARAVMTAWRESGLSRRAFAEREGLKVARLDYWAGRLRDLDRRSGIEADERERSAFVPVQIVEHGAHLPGGGPSCVEIVLPSGTQLRLPEGCSPRRLGQLLEVLQGASLC